MQRSLDVHFSCIALQGLSDTNNYHEFCRLLARLKSNYQLGELVKVDNYPQVIKLIAEFTVTSLQVWINHMVQPYFVRLLIIAKVSWSLSLILWFSDTDFHDNSYSFWYNIRGFWIQLNEVKDNPFNCCKINTMRQIFSCKGRSIQNPD